MIGAVVQVAWSDIRANGLAWLALAVTMAAAGAGLAFALAFLVEGSADASELGGTVLGLALMSTIASTSTISGLIVDERRAVYSAWKLAGMRGSSSFVVIVAQVFGVGAVFSAVGAVALAPPLVGPAAEVVRGEGVEVGAPSVSALVFGLAVAICAGAAAVGALGRGMSVAVRSPVTSARASTVPKAAPGFWSTMLGLLFGLCVIPIAMEVDFHEEPEAIPALSVMALLAMVCLAGWYIRPVLQWTRLLGAAGPVAGLAAASSRSRSAFTSAQVVPWFLVAGMIVGIGSPVRVLAAAEGGVAMSGTSVLAVLLAPALVPALVAAVGSVCVMAPRARADVLVLRRAGASRAQLVRSLGWEATAVTATAGALSMSLALGGVIAANAVLSGTPFPAGWWESVLWLPLGAILAAMWALVVGAKLAVARP